MIRNIEGIVFVDLRNDSPTITDDCDDPFNVPLTFEIRNYYRELECRDILAKSQEADAAKNAQCGATHNERRRQHPKTWPMPRRSPHAR